MHTRCDDGIYVIGVEEKYLEKNLKSLIFHTTRGDFEAILHTHAGSHKGVIMLGGYSGGFDGPGSVFSDLSHKLSDCGIMSLRLDYRHPGDCAQCGIDALLALQYLDDDAVHDVVLIGWSFGGAVAITAGSLAKSIRGIAAVSTIEVADCCAKRLRSKPLLLIHGESDLTSPIVWPKRVYSLAKCPRDLIIYADVGHDMQKACGRLVKDLSSWIVHTLSHHHS
jgi:alpha/beta superfamily hydrolase